MYGGAAVEPNVNMNQHHPVGSPIPQQWWDQEGQGHGPGGQGPSHNGMGRNPSPGHGQGMSAMDAAAANANQSSYRSASPSQLTQRMNGMGMNNGNSAPAYGSYSPMNKTNGQRSPTTPIGGNIPSPPNAQPRGPSANGLIRLTIKKPMGIVFEPMEDPHNPSQQRGVRICDLPRTGAAALSGMLEVGDELLSLNNKTMSRLTFDEIMDFIIDADAESVDLLFRRPKKATNRVGKVDKTKNSAVKWDENVADAATQDADEATMDEDSPRGKRSPPRKASQRDEEASQYSADDTFYTEQTSVYTEDTRQQKRGAGNRRRRYESESFLDMLIDTVCAPMIGGSDKRGDYSDDDMTFNSMDEDTYASGDESYTFLEQKKKKWQESRKKRSEREKRSLEEDQKKKSKKKNEKSRSKKQFEPEKVQPYEPEEPQAPLGHNDGHGHMGMNDPYAHKPIDPVPYMETPNPEILGVPDMNGEQQPQSMHHPSSSKSPPRSSNADPMARGAPKSPPHARRSPNQRSPMMDKPMIPEAMPQEQAPQTNGNGPEPIMPFKEIAYDDQVDENVSVMESVGGPSLLLENLRNAQTIQRTVESDIIALYGKDFKPDLGLTREESIQLNPGRFYKHAVKKILEQNEPEKVRLMDKLFDKYLGREEHLIRKLGARYAANEPANSIEPGRTSSSDGVGAYDGFKAFGGGDFSQSGSGSHSKSEHFDDTNAWQSQDVPQFGTNDDVDMPADDGFKGGFPDTNDHNDEDDHSSYSEESDYDSIDGTSPEVIAQVSELLNYVYGKTTVAGQIDRVSTIMRAYEGREAILLELLETKALLKANNDKGSLDDLPDSLKDNPGLQQNPSVAEVQMKENNNVMSPISNMTHPSTVNARTSPVPVSSSASNENNPFNIDRQDEAPAYSTDKKKKKGFFGRFKKKKSGKGEFPTNRSKSALLGNQ
jgi:hypothetical protein